MTDWRMGLPGGTDRLAARFASHGVSGAARHDDEGAYGIAHEVNQPLAAIVANADACLSCLWGGSAGFGTSAYGREAHPQGRTPRECRAQRNTRRAQESCAGDVGVQSQSGIRDILDLMRNELNQYDLILQIDLCKREGTGVGLSICRSIVEAHGGVLCATRKESPGSVFPFTVPLIHPPISIQN